MLVHGRDQARGRETVEEIIQQTGNDDVHWLRADLASLDEVRGLAGQIIAERRAVHTLVNNAGIGTTLPGDGRRMESRDGYELRCSSRQLPRAS